MMSELFLEAQLRKDADIQDCTKQTESNRKE
jgi:hypothetical protein